MRSISRLAAFIFCLASCGTAAASGLPHVHDKFYMRLGAGPGYVIGTNEPDHGGGKADVSGLALSTELAFGGTLAPGLVFGGGSFSMVVPSPTYSFEGGGDVDAGTITCPALDHRRRLRGLGRKAVEHRTALAGHALQRVHRGRRRRPQGDLAHAGAVAAVRCDISLTPRRS